MLVGLPLGLGAAQQHCVGARWLEQRQLVERQALAARLRINSTVVSFRCWNSALLSDFDNLACQLIALPMQLEQLGPSCKAPTQFSSS